MAKEGATHPLSNARSRDDRRARNGFRLRRKGTDSADQKPAADVTRSLPGTWLGLKCAAHIGDRRMRTLAKGLALGMLLVASAAGAEPNYRVIAQLPAGDGG